MIRFAAAVMLLAAGCIPRADLSAPPRSASIPERLIAYDQLSTRHADVAATSGHHAPNSSFLVLGNGARVSDPRDLARVVDPASPTAQAARRYTAHWSRAKRWFASSAVMFGAALATSVVGAVAIDDPTRRLEVVVGAGVVGTLGSLVLLGIGVGSYANAYGEQVSAFATYDDSLRRRLNLCVDGLAIVACETASTAPAALNRQ